MADERKILGQIALTVNTETALYTVPASETADVNITVTNRGKQDTVVRIRIAVADAAVNDKQYIAYDYPVPANEQVEFNDLKVQATDVIYVKTPSPNLTVQAFGLETA